MSPLAVTLLALVMAAVAIVTVAAFVRRRASEPDAAWWQRPTTWIGVSVVIAVLGLVVAPKLFGFTFVFLPFLWMGGGMGRRDRRQPHEHDADA